MATARNPKLIRMVQLAILLALEAIMAFTPIGFVSVGIVSITLMHIPVIIGAILLGPLAGAILGGGFGVLAILRVTFMGGVGLDLLFNPGASGNPLASLAVAIVPRVLLGLAAAWLYLLFKRLCKTDYVALPLSAALASLLHSVLVLGGLFFLFQGHPLMESLTLKSMLATIGTLNGLIELAVGVVLTTAICRPLLLAFGRSSSPALSKRK